MMCCNHSNFGKDNKRREKNDDSYDQQRKRKVQSGMAFSQEKEKLRTTNKRTASKTCIF